MEVEEKKSKKSFLVMVGIYFRQSPCHEKQHEDIYEYHTRFASLCIGDVFLAEINV
ncbi:hypothetical protein MCOR25_001716 [Pyricularia grisea]|nr:hypothetical protein MCOR25_001716 [Pyricularia grisea]